MKTQAGKCIHECFEWCSTDWAAEANFGSEIDGIMGFFGLGLKSGLGRKLRRRRVEFLTGYWGWVGFLPE